jgi:hypothetical protein
MNKALSDYFSIKRAIANVENDGTKLGFVVGYEYDFRPKLEKEERHILRALCDFFESSQLGYPLVIHGSVPLEEDEIFVFKEGQMQHSVSLRNFPVQVSSFDFVSFGEFVKCIISNTCSNNYLMLCLLF